MMEDPGPWKKKEKGKNTRPGVEERKNTPHVLLANGDRVSDVLQDQLCGMRKKERYNPEHPIASYSLHGCLIVFRSEACPENSNREEGIEIEKFGSPFYSYGQILSFLRI